MTLQLLTPPAVEPIDLADAKRHLRLDVDITDDDALITLMIGMARRACEAKTGRSLIRQSWRLVMDGFPGSSGPVRIDRGPVVSIDAIGWIDTSGTTRTVTSPGRPDYAIDLNGQMPRIAPGFGRIWPIALPEIGSAWIDFTAGYGMTGVAVPETLRAWMLVQLTTLYTYRERVASGASVDELPYVDALLDGDRNWLV